MFTQLFQFLVGFILPGWALHQGLECYQGPHSQFITTQFFIGLSQIIVSQGVTRIQREDGGEISQCVLKIANRMVSEAALNLSFQIIWLKL